MLFSIDFDTRTVECKAVIDKTEEQLSQYYFDNELENAVCLVSSAEEIELAMSIKEMEDLAQNLCTNNKREKFTNEEDAAERCWELLTAMESQFPEFNSKLGKKLLKEAEKRCSEKPMKKAKHKAKTQTKTDGKRWTSKSLSGKVLEVGEKVPKEGTIHHINWFFIENNLGEASVEEVVENFCFVEDCDEKKALGYITGGIRRNYLKVQE